MKGKTRNVDSPEDIYRRRADQVEAVRLNDERNLLNPSPLAVEMRCIRAIERLAAIQDQASTPGKEPDDPKLIDIQQAYDTLKKQDCKAPSQRAVALYADYHRSTVKARWSKVRK